MQTPARAAKQVAGKEPLDISNTAQLRDPCLAAARVFGWNGESQVNVAVNNQIGVVIIADQKQELHEKLKPLQEQWEQKEQLRQRK
jgi:hypothetical protein